MPVYQYQDLKTGELVEMVRSVAQRDSVGPHLKRITVPARLAIAGTSSDPKDEHSADYQVPRAFKQLEGKIPAKEIVREGGFTVDQVKRAWGM